MSGGGWVLTPPWTYLSGHNPYNPQKGPSTRGTTPRRDLVPEILTSPRKGHGTRDTPRQNDWQTPVKTVPSRNYTVAGGKNVLTCCAWCCACSSICRSLCLILSWSWACDLFPSSSSPARFWYLLSRTFSCSTVFFRCLLSFLQNQHKIIHMVLFTPSKNYMPLLKK